MAIPVVDITRIIEWIKNAGADLVKWLAFRAFLLAIVSTVVPIAIYSGWLLIQEKLVTYTQSQMTSGDMWSGTMVELTGLGAWLADKLQFQACFSVLATAVAFKFVLGFFHKG